MSERPSRNCFDLFTSKGSLHGEHPFFVPPSGRHAWMALKPFFGVLCRKAYWLSESPFALRRLTGDECVRLRGLDVHIRRHSDEKQERTTPTTPLFLLFAQPQLNSWEALSSSVPVMRWDSLAVDVSCLSGERPIKLDKTPLFTSLT